MLNSSLSFQYPFWFVIFCVAAGTAYAGVLYYRDVAFAEQNDRGFWWKYSLTTWRFISVTVLAVLLLSPFLRTRTTQQFKPIVVVINDNSQSVQNGLKADSSEFKNKLRALINRLGEKYEVAEFNIGDRLTRGIDFSYGDKSTNLSTAFEEINNLYYNQNLGAVVLASDGIYNSGVNPVYSTAKSAYSVYTIALGDTTVQKDQKLSNVLYNKIAYLNDQFALRIDVEETNLAGKNSKLSVYELTGGGAERLVQSKEIAYADNSFFQSYDFVLSANQTGISHYRVSLSNISGEVTYRNNVREVFLEVLDGRQKILLVANSPHPDIAAFRAAIESNHNYQLDVEYAETFSKKLNDYNLVILHQLPSASNKAQNILKDARDLQKPLFFIVGSQTALGDFQKGQNALIIKASGSQTNDVTAKTAKDFALFTLSDKTLQTIPKLPPLSCYFGNFAANPSGKALLQQKINSVETDFPLWVFNETGEQKICVLSGENIWRWRLYDYLINKNHDATNELINKSIQYLSVKNDKRPFRVLLAKNIFQDNEVISFEAQLYNSTYELVNNADVEMKIKDDLGKTLDYQFSKTEKAYQLNAGFLPVGNYSYSASAKLGNGTYTAAGKFSISPLQLEELQTRANHQVLYQLASQHNGSMHSITTMDKIADEIEAKNTLKPILFDTFSTESAINLKWIFFLLLSLLSVEWISRKYLGGY